MSNQQVFNKIYATNAWAIDSGTGSMVEHAMTYINYLNSFISHYKIKTVLDLGSGDTKILRELNLDKLDSYTCVEVSDLAIEKYYKNLPKNVNVVNDDITTFDYPEVDLILIKDVLQHLDIQSIKKIMEKIFKSCKYAIITNDILLTNENKDIDSGGYRGLDLKKDPFNYSNLQMIDTYLAFQEIKAICLYRKHNEII